jgi:uncharacterized membrane protein
MPQFCAACGAQMADGATTCPACGKSSATSAGGGTAAAPAASSGSNDNVIALLCYSPVAIVGIIMGLAVEPYKNSKLVRFHAFQSIFVVVAMIALAIGVMILGAILGSVLGILALPIMGLLYFALWAGTAVLLIFMMIKAYKGEMKRLPVIGDMAAKQAGV